MVIVISRGIQLDGKGKLYLHIACMATLYFIDAIIKHFIDLQPLTSFHMRTSKH